MIFIAKLKMKNVIELCLKINIIYKTLLRLN